MRDKQSSELSREVRDIWNLDLVQTTDTTTSTGGVDAIHGDDGDDLILGGHSQPDYFMGLLAEIRIWGGAQDPATIATRVGLRRSAGCD